MKRSEMVNMMYDKFIEEHIVKSETIYVSIEKLLTFMEEAGMKPPAYAIGFFTVPYSGCDAIFVEWVEETVNRWEPEDEKK